eukprot:TRINITY_DN2592_c2_g1_i2.p1 TRINITY_DN2592_c2_g1~~TRINITY_DN2592_c2_g1_i2.p1  ORF type:complete len:280 (-),score=61.50 TRINITY_DN2592_c2_g1_i2:41-766(-)
MRESKSFWNGSVLLYKNMKVVSELNKKPTLTEQEYRFKYNTVEDFKGALPIVVLFILPIVGYLVPVLIISKPSILPPVYRNDNQKLVSSKELHKVQARIATELANKFKANPLVNLEDLDDDSLSKLSEFFSFSTSFVPTFFLKKKLSEHLEYIKQDDLMLVSENKVDDLDKMSLIEICTNRGLCYKLEEFGETEVNELKSRLKSWLNTTTNERDQHSHFYVKFYIVNFINNYQQQQQQQQQ